MTDDDDFSITVDVTQAVAFFAKMKGGMPRFMNELKRQLALEALATEKPLVPVAVRQWTPETVLGELRRSVDAFKKGDTYVVGPTAKHKKFPYGIAVSRGTAFRGRAAQAGPRPFDEWTMAEMKAKVDPMSSKILEKHMQRWS